MNVDIVAIIGNLVSGKAEARRRKLWWLAKAGSINASIRRRLEKC